MRDRGNVVYEKQTGMGHIVVRNRQEDGEWVRYLMINGKPQSAMYLNPARRNELIFPYMKSFSYAFSCRPGIRRTLLIGGGGFAYPRYYHARYPERYLAVAEPGREIIEVSREYFGLKELEEDEEHFQLIPEDGFAWLDQTEENFDLIINDAFLGGRSVGRTEEDTARVKAHLAPDGIYLINVVTAERGLFALPGKRYMRAVTRHLPHGTMIACGEGEPGIRPVDPQNCILAASAEPL